MQRAANRVLVRVEIIRCAEPGTADDFVEVCAISVWSDDGIELFIGDDSDGIEMPAVILSEDGEGKEREETEEGSNHRVQRDLVSARNAARIRTMIRSVCTRTPFISIALTARLWKERECLEKRGRRLISARGGQSSGGDRACIALSALIRRMYEK